MQLRIVLSVLLLAGAALAQTTPNSVTVTATQNTSVPPDQAVFWISVTAPLTASQDDVLTALQGSGITLANFTNVYTVTVSNICTASGCTSQQNLQWNFTWIVPYSDLKSTIQKLNGLQLALTKGDKGLALSFSVSRAQASAQSQVAACSLTDLISSARAQALKLANAADKSLGAINNMSTFVSDAAAACSVTVQFALGAF
jgi:hypothetical protein